MLSLPDVTGATRLPSTVIISSNLQGTAIERARS
jgi:hypothetical protein